MNALLSVYKSRRRRRSKEKRSHLSQPSPFNLHYSHLYFNKACYILISNLQLCVYGFCGSSFIRSPIRPRLFLCVRSTLSMFGEINLLQCITIYSNVFTLKQTLRDRRNARYYRIRKKSYSESYNAKPKRIDNQPNGTYITTIKRKRERL